jgi:hypothetical protein
VSAPAGAVRNVRALQALLAERYPDARPLVERDAQRALPPVATGVGALDAALPGGGLPRGKLTAWAPEGGAAAVLRSACRQAIAGGERAAWVDATRLLTAGWAPAGAGAEAGAAAWPLPLLVYPRDRTDALRCAECVLASGAFALVVLEPPPADEPVGTETVRLARAARDGGAALVVLTERTSMAALRVAARLDVRGVRWRHGPFGPAAPVAVRADVRVRALGWNARADVTLAVAGYDLRDALDPGPDRRASVGTAGAAAPAGPAAGTGNPAPTPARIPAPA